MTIGLVAVDSVNYPNLALMKLSASHKAKGDLVEWYNPFNQYDIVYLSKVFSFTPDYQIITNASVVIKGGSGYALNGAGGESYNPCADQPLPHDIEHIYPDYDLYGIKDTAYGRLTIGCPRNCRFCIVGKKEGLHCRKVADLSEFWREQKNIVLFDSNLLACQDWKELCMQLYESKAWVDFNQGLDARLLTPSKCEVLSSLKMKKIHFAWDNYEDKDMIVPKLKMFANHSKLAGTHNAIVYVLVNYNSTLDQDLERIYILRELGFWAYVMIYDKAHCAKVYRHLQRWCNNRAVFAKVPFFKYYA